jgi:2-oxoglutarate/2-oxoacid ferredoxin oxidoreductase subunit alpha
MTLQTFLENIVAGPTSKPVRTLTTVAIRFAGDSGDGMQLAGARFTASSAMCGSDVATLPDYPAEIRAPAGTLAGVSGFQVNFSSSTVRTPGDIIQSLVAMNPAALKVSLPDIEDGGVIILDADGFTADALKLAGYEANPVEDGSLSHFEVYPVPMTRLTQEAVRPAGLKPKDAERCRNVFALGLVCWLYDRSVEPTLLWLEQKFGRKPEVLKANEAAFKAGYQFARSSDLFPVQYRVERARLAPGTYRTIRGNEAAALGLVAAARRAKKQLLYASYPITPASDILHDLAKWKNFGVKVFQTEDEIAAMCAVIGAAYGGAFAATGTSGPGLSLKSEALGLAVMLELPCVIIDVQRAGPSTGMPTKSEQSDLFQALAGRHGDCPMPVLAAQSPADCFDIVIEAFQIAVEYATPVMVLTDGYLGNSAELWRVPHAIDLPRIEVAHPIDPAGFQPYSRNEKLARPWALPGTPGLAHRIGGLEKQEVTGAVTYDPMNHQRMSELRAAKVAKVADRIPDVQVFGDQSGELLIVSWGSTYGAVRTAVERARQDGLPVSHAHLRYLNPLPRNLGRVLGRFRKILVPELNMGQFRMVLRATFLVDAQGMNKVQGKPFTIGEILARIERMCKEGESQ